MGHFVTVKKANTQNTMVNLFIHPYDYEEALTLIEELFRSNMNPSPKWRKQWDEYLSNIPNYYIPHFRFVLPHKLWTCVLNPLASFWYYFSLETSAGNGLFQIAIDCFQTKLSSNVGFRANIIKTRYPGFNKIDSKTNFCIPFILFSGEIGHSRSNPGLHAVGKMKLDFSKHPL